MTVQEINDKIARNNSTIAALTAAIDARAVNSGVVKDSLNDGQVSMMSEYTDILSMIKARAVLEKENTALTNELIGSITYLRPY
jgi:hypothetical protein